MKNPDTELFHSLENIANPSQEQMDLIFQLYKKYVNPFEDSYRTGCNCQNSIENIYFKLMNHYKWNQGDIDSGINITEINLNKNK